MYLSEEKRTLIRKCIENQQSNSENTKTPSDKAFHDTEDSRKVSQILFDARDGREIFKPF